MLSGGGRPGPWRGQAGQTDLLAALALLAALLELLEGDLPLQVLDQLRAEARHGSATARGSPVRDAPRPSRYGARRYGARPREFRAAAPR